MHPTIQRLREVTKTTYDLNHAASLIFWDQQTHMPLRGATRHGEVQSTLAQMAHEAFLDKRVCDALEAAEAVHDQLSDDEKRIVQLTRREYDIATQLPSEFVLRQASAKSVGYQAWLQARKENDLKIFLPALAENIAIAQEYARHRGFFENPYDAHLDIYEPGITQAELDPLFDDLRDFLVPFIKKITALPQGDGGILTKHYPAETQRQFSQQVVVAMGFDLHRGRFDIAEHPFCSGLHPDDVRITTRFFERELLNAITSSIHEAGHALYEQNLPAEWHGTSLCSATSIGFHETQSRIWEVLVGLGLPFWEHFFPRLRELFPEQLADVSVSDFYKAINIVSPTFIRTECDEVTYNIHIIIRYELEKQLIEGSLSVEHIESAWNDHYQEYLGITPKNLKEGVLQDVHWAESYWGYFPTYTLGNLGAVQLFDKAQQEIPNLSEQFQKGDFGHLLRWLIQNVHVHGSRYTTDELLRKVTGKPLGIEAFVKRLNAKYPIT